MRNTPRIHRLRPVLEDIEPRILMSADHPLAAAVAGGMVLQGTEDAAVPAAATTTELVFIDYRVQDRDRLVANLQAQAGEGRRIEAVLLEAGDDAIVFNIAVQTISPTSALPTITDTLTINGYTQSDATPNTASKVSGLAIGGFSGAGILTSVGGPSRSAATSSAAMPPARPPVPTHGRGRKALRQGPCPGHAAGLRDV